MSTSQRQADRMQNTSPLASRLQESFSQSVHDSDGEQGPLASAVAVHKGPDDSPVARVQGTSDGGFLRSNFSHSARHKRSPVAHLWQLPLSNVPVKVKPNLPRKPVAQKATTASDGTRADVPEWKRKLLAKKNEAGGNDGVANATVPAWKKALMEKKRRGAQADQGSAATRATANAKPAWLLEREQKKKTRESAEREKKSDAVSLENKGNVPEFIRLRASMHFEKEEVIVSNDPNDRSQRVDDLLEEDDQGKTENTVLLPISSVMEATTVVEPTDGSCDDGQRETLDDEKVKEHEDDADDVKDTAEESKGKVGQDMDGPIDGAATRSMKPENLFNVQSCNDSDSSHDEEGKSMMRTSASTSRCTRSTDVRSGYLASDSDLSGGGDAREKGGRNTVLVESDSLSPVGSLLDPNLLASPCKDVQGNITSHDSEEQRKQKSYSPAEISFRHETGSEMIVSDSGRESHAAPMATTATASSGLSPLRARGRFDHSSDEESSGSSDKEEAKIKPSVPLSPSKKVASFLDDSSDDESDSDQVSSHPTKNGSVDGESKDAVLESRTPNKHNTRTPDKHNMEVASAKGSSMEENGLSHDGARQKKSKAKKKKAKKKNIAEDSSEAKKLSRKKKSVHGDLSTKKKIASSSPTKNSGTKKKSASSMSKKGKKGLSDAKF